MISPKVFSKLLLMTTMVCMAIADDEPTTNPQTIVIKDEGHPNIANTSASVTESSKTDLSSSANGTTVSTNGSPVKDDGKIHKHCMNITASADLNSLKLTACAIEYNNCTDMNLVKNGMMLGKCIGLCQINGTLNEAIGYETLVDNFVQIVNKSIVSHDDGYSRVFRSWPFVGELSTLAKKLFHEESLSSDFHSYLNNPNKLFEGLFATIDNGDVGKTNQWLHGEPFNTGFCELTTNHDTSCKRLNRMRSDIVELVYVNVSMSEKCQFQ